MYFANDKEERAFIAECLEDFRRPVGPNCILRDTLEYKRYLQCVSENISTIISRNKCNHTKKVNIAKGILLAILIIISCCIIVAFVLIALSCGDFGGWLLYILFAPIISLFIIILGFCYDNILKIEKKTFNIYKYLLQSLYANRDKVLLHINIASMFNKYNSKLSEACFLVAFRNSNLNASEYSNFQRTDSAQDFSSYLRRNELILIIFADAERLANRRDWDYEDEVFLNLSHDEIIKKYEEELYSKDNAPIPDSFFS